MRYALIALTLLFGAGCGLHPQRPDFIWLNGSEPETIDPHIITGQPEGRLAEGLFEGLCAHDPKTSAAIPGAAQKWDVSADKRTYTFHLRPGLRWSNGDPLTAEDFVWSWKRALEPATAADYAYQLYYVVNAKGYNEGTLKDFKQVGVRALDPLTLEVRLEHPTPFFLDLAANPILYPVHRATLERHGDDWVKPQFFVGNGPYRLKEWRLNAYLDLEKNPYYWDAANVQLPWLRALPAKTAFTAFSIYQTGGADLILDKGLVPTALLDELKTRPDFHSATFLGTFFYRFNVKRKPFDDPRVRKALALCINRELLVQKITKAGEQPAYGFVPPGIPGYAPARGPGYDPELGRKLLAQAGFPGGRGFPSFSILFNTAEVNQDIGVEIQRMWKQELGIDCLLQNQDWKVYLNSQAQLDYDVSRSSWVGDYNDPNTFLDMFMTDNGNNRTGYSDPKYDAMIEEANRTTDEKSRFALFQKAEAYLLNDGAPIVPIYYYVGINFFDPKRWDGLYGNVLDVHPLKAIRRRGSAR